MNETYKNMDIYCFAVKFSDGFQPNYKITLHGGINLVIKRECTERYPTEKKALEFAMERAKCKIDAGLSEDVW